MLIRRATKDEMLVLWGDPPDAMRPTTAFFYENIKTGNAQFWAYDRDGDIVGELYVFKSLDDPDYANGTDRAYLCSFRIIEELRGQGYGTNLIVHTVGQLARAGIPTVTIGVEEGDEANLRLYRRLGFTDKVKDCYDDPCDVDEHMQPKPCAKCWLLKRENEASGEYDAGRKIHGFSDGE